MKILTLLFLLVIPVSVYSQKDSSLTFGLPEMRIKQKEKGKIITYLFENRLNKFTLTPTALLPDTNRYNYKVKLSDINLISFHDGALWWPVARTSGIVGFVLGFVAGGFFSWDAHPRFNLGRAFYGAVLFTVPFALLGGVIGLLLPNYEEYDINKLNVSQKYDILKKLFIKYRLLR
ncbi:MAG: hypothetical protein ABI543_11135 [Ignavibacteria bacterium]